jgi:hypothetical protein
MNADNINNVISDKEDGMTGHVARIGEIRMGAKYWSENVKGGALKT